MPELLNFDWLHILSINVLQQVGHIFMDDPNQSNIAANLNRIHIMNGSFLIVGQFCLHQSFAQQILQSLFDLFRHFGNLPIIFISLWQVFRVHFLVKSITFVLNVRI